MRALRGSQISMILQEPKMSLNPVIRVGDQVAETLLVHDRTLSRRVARERAVEMLAIARHPGPAAGCAAVSARAVRRHGPTRHDRA